MGTRVYVQPSGRLIEPFGDTPGQTLIHDKPLVEWQTQMIGQAGLERIDKPAPPCLVVPDTLFTNAVVLRRFVELAAGRNSVLVLRDSSFARRTAPLQPCVVKSREHFRFEAVRFLSGGDEPPLEALIDPEERMIEMPIPPAFADARIEVSLPRNPVITLHHWVHILWANQAAGAMLARNTPPAKFALRAAWAFARARSFNRWRLLGKANEIGRGCNIHPTALVEGSTLEDGVRVGPFARVLVSRVGRGAVVMSGAQVEASVIGERAMVCQQTTIRLCVVYPGAVAGQRLMQMCVLGRDAVTFAGSWSIDFNLDHDTRVPLDGVLHSTGTRFLGSAFGHNCRMGTGSWLAPGRMIPNGAIVVRSPDEVISRIDPDLPPDVPMVNSRGILLPIEQFGETIPNPLPSLDGRT